MDKYFTLFVSIAIFGHSATGRTWGDYNYHYDYPTPPRHNHQNFNYNNWCNNANGWDWNNSWEDYSNENYSSGEDKVRSTRTSSSTSTTSRNVEMVISDSEGKTTHIRAASIGSTPSPVEILLCLRLCPLTSEFNPVCGTDNITYRNPGRLECARTCGISVSIQRFSACETNPATQPPVITTPSRPTSAPITGLPQSQLVFMTCVRNCPSTAEYNPVCGSDGITYDNPSRFHCAKNCGKTDIIIARTSRCPPVTPSDPATRPVLTSTQSTSLMTTQPTQATSSATTQSTSSARPTRFTTIEANPAYTSQGPNAITSEGLGFTIPQNILNGIFDIETTQPAYNVDERLGS